MHIGMIVQIELKLKRVVLLWQLKLENVVLYSYASLKGLYFMQV